jgi:hypothetical protein
VRMRERKLDGLRWGVGYAAVSGIEVEKSRDGSAAAVQRCALMSPF